jgi:hypothetical protein
MRLIRLLIEETLLSTPKWFVCQWIVAILTALANFHKPRDFSKNPHILLFIAYLNSF